MYKVAILGTENSHAFNFAQLINGGHPQRGGRGISDFRVIGAYGYDEEANKQIAQIGGVEMIADRSDAFLGKVDAVMVTARHGDNHLKYAEPYIKSGIPAFIDKPITIDEKEAISLVNLAKDHHVPLCGGSCCGFVTSAQSLKAAVLQKSMGKIMGGSIAAPVSMKNDYGDFFFYSQHLSQIMLEVFGYDIKSVFAYAREDSVTAINRYEHYDVTAHYGSRKYAVSVYGEKDILQHEINVQTDGYAHEVEVFTEMVRSGVMPQSYRDFIIPVFHINALKKSFDSGIEVPVTVPQV